MAKPKFSVPPQKYIHVAQQIDQWIFFTFNPLEFWGDILCIKQTVIVAQHIPPEI